VYLRAAIQRLAIQPFICIPDPIIERSCIALDAGAHSINVEVNTGTYFLVVSDNGHGIPPGEVPKIAQSNCMEKSLAIAIVVNNY
jgi:hypothetical protein